jgi:hypothetical protein
VRRQRTLITIDTNKNAEFSADKKLVLVEAIERTSKEELAANGVSLPTAPNPFDLASLRIDQSRLAAPATKKKLLRVPVKKPGRQDFFRVHPTEATPAIGIIEVEREMYIAAPHLIDEIRPLGGYPAILHLAVTRSKVVFLIPVRLPEADGTRNSWAESLEEAVMAAKGEWVSARANMDLGGYDLSIAEPEIIPDPVWPSESISELVGIAFKNRFIDREDHPVLLKLAGLA